MELSEGHVRKIRNPVTNPNIRKLRNTAVLEEMPVLRRAVKIPKTARPYAVKMMRQNSMILKDIGIVIS